MGDVSATIARRREELQELEEAAEQAAQLKTRLDGLRDDLARLEARRDKFAAYGNRPIEIEQRSFDQRFHCEIEWEPIRSRKSGKELAAEVEKTCAELRREISGMEKQIGKLVGGR
jgi:hypothetical protein